MRILLALFLFVSVTTLSPEVSSAEEGSPIYVVDIRKVIKESVAGKASINNAEAEKKKKQVVLERMKNEIDSLADSVQKQKALLSKAALREKEDALEKKALDFRRAVQDTEKELAKSNQNEILKILDEVNDILKDLAKERPITFVFDSDPQVVVYASERVDLTDEVIEQLDERKIGL